ncbi:MAG TPA: hypothetical protein VFH25_00400 [Nitrososphaeraceae archaeon]|nr:hypothetical protein [Nitrososphaeraceae archaeon]
MDVQVCDTSNNRGSNLAPFDKISKSGDGKTNLFMGIIIFNYY